jgi:hypothetical protein
MPNYNRSTERAPAFWVYAGNSEVGAAWRERTAVRPAFCQARHFTSSEARLEIGLDDAGHDRPAAVPRARKPAGDAHKTLVSSPSRLFAATLISRTRTMCCFWILLDLGAPFYLDFRVDDRCDMQGLKTHTGY